MEGSEIETLYPVAMAIREFLMKRGGASPSDFYQVYREYKRSTSYPSIARYFWILKEEGLIKVVGHEKPRYARLHKTLYSIVPERLDDELWQHPQRRWKSYRREKK